MKPNNILIDKINFVAILKDKYEAVCAKDDAFMTPEINTDLNVIVKVTEELIKQKPTMLKLSADTTVIRILYSANRRQCLRIVVRMLLLGELVGFTYKETKDYLLTLQYILSNSTDYP